MQTNSQNFTVEDLDTCQRFVFRYKYADSSPARLVIVSVLSAVFPLIFCVGFLFKIPSSFQYMQNMQIEEYLLFMLFYALFLLLPLYSVASTFLDMFWGLNGKEIVEISSAGIVIHHQALIFETSKSFEAERIPCLFVSRQNPSRFSFPPRTVRFYNFGKGRIAFNDGIIFFGGVITVRFGSILKPDEARQVIEIIHKRFPQYKCAAKSAG